MKHCGLHGQYEGPDCATCHSNFETICDANVKVIRNGGLSEQKTESALDVQIGGGHYKNMAIQPMEYSMKNGLDACQHTAIKYISRFRDKGGIQDLEKAKHCIDMLIQFEQEKNQ